MRAIKRLLRAWLLVAALCGGWGASSSAEIEVQQRVKTEGCTAPSSEVMARDFTVELPMEVVVPLGYRWTAKPISATFGDRTFGTDGADSLSFTAGSVTFGIGVVDARSIRARLLVSDSELCRAGGRFSVLLEIRGGQPLGIRVNIVPGADTATFLAPAARTEAIVRAMNVYKESIEFTIGEQQEWLSIFEAAVEDPPKRDALGARLCGSCKWSMQQYLAYGLAELFRAYPAIIGAGPDSLEFVFSTTWECPLGNTARTDYGMYSVSGVIRIGPRGDKSSFLEFRRRGGDQPKLERVVVAGKVVSDVACLV